ncbi:MAG: hypothetical protein UV73_C0019G0002 [Candidatus Gottesmanbacteria bacterium GW2011_GWA2_43_14]|uniref:Uncharacterized protein n=1 Tax=Candidatus Gottesmanbacteria bacterium GW2011_GWA2_43_14 TaxID=1618443 RepID=A0A0G1DBQ2_9BACT|nr:MAG: hypothetical protein UV73_C0019G0002 [Candidatus Gottesmanbacteria bacterium GW2011_GWA2_43_14]
MADKLDPVITRLEQLGLPNQSKSDPNLNRKDFDYLTGLTAVSSLLKIPAIPGLASSESAENKSLGMWESIKFLSGLKVDPNTVRLETEVDDKWNTRRLILTFLSGNIALITPDQSVKNPNPSAARINISVDITDQKNNIDWSNRFQDLKRYLTTGGRTIQAIESFRSNRDVNLALGILGFNVKDKKKLALITATLLAAILAACDLATEQSPETTRETLEHLVTPTPGSVPETQTTPQVEYLPAPTLPATGSILIDSDYLIDQMLKVGHQNLLPESTPVGGETVNQYSESARDFAARVFKESDFRPENNPLQTLMLVVSDPARKGRNRSANYFTEGLNGEDKAFKGLILYREQANEGEYTLGDCKPANLVVRSGAGITVLGRTEDNRYVITVEENIPRYENQNKPRMYFAILSKEQFTQLSVDKLDNMDFYLDKPDHIQFLNSDTNETVTLPLNIITQDVLKQISNKAGVSWEDKVSGGDESSYYAEPLIPYPNKDDLKKDINPLDLNYVRKLNDRRLGHPRNLTYQAIDPGNNELVGIGEYNIKSKEWVWNPPNWKNISESLGFLLGDTTLSSFDYYNPDFQQALADNFQMTGPGSFYAHNFDRGLNQLFLNLTQENDQSLYIHPLFWQNMLPRDLYGADAETFKKWEWDRIRQVFEYIKPIQPGGKPTILVLGNEYLFHIFPDTGEFQSKVNVDPDNNNNWIENPYSKAHGDSITALTEQYLWMLEEAANRGLRIGIDFIPLYNHFNNHADNSTTKEVVRELKQVKSNVASHLGVSEAEVILGVGIQGNFFYNNRPSWITAPPSVDQLSNAINSQSEVGPVFLIDLNIIGLDQSGKKARWAEFIDCALKSNCSGLTFWRSLLSSKKPGQITDKLYDDPANLFDPDNKYRPVPGNGYEEVTATLLAEANSRGLIG